MQRLGGALGRLSGSLLGGGQAHSPLTVELAEQQQQQEQRHSSQPQLITRAGTHDEPPRACGSSGAGLPSALSTPRPPPGRAGGASQAAAAAAGAGQQDDDGDTPDSPGRRQQDEPATTVSQQQPKGVRWLPGLQSAGNPPSTADAAPAAEVADAGAASSSSRLGRSSSANSASGALVGSQRPLPPSGDEQLDRYLAYLLREQRHSFLFFSGWGISEEACAALAAFLRRDRRVKAMTLGGNGISDEGAELLADGLAANSTLISLDLSDNSISSVGAVALAEALHSDKCVLSELQLANNKISDEGAEALAAAVAASALRKLNLQGNPISPAQLQVVSHVLKTREYRVPSSEPRPCGGNRSSSSSRARHVRKASSHLQFDIELMESSSYGQGLERSMSSSSVSRQQRHKDLLHLPPAVAVAALTEHTDPLESTISMQAAHLLAELHSKQPAASSSLEGAAAATTSSSSSSGGDAATSPSGPSDLLAQLALRLASHGFEVVVRTCCPTLDAGAGAAGAGAAAPGGQHKHQHQHQAAGTECQLTGLRHSFLRVSLPEAGVVQGRAPVIVDAHFREQFVMPHPTQRYAGVLKALPAVLCLNEARMWLLLERLATEMATAFRETRLTLPPWRHPAAVHDKWLGPVWRDAAVDADSSVEVLSRRLATASLGPLVH